MLQETLNLKKFGLRCANNMARWILPVCFSRIDMAKFETPYNLGIS
jgi:hypothetical protein